MSKDRHRSSRVTAAAIEVTGSSLHLVKRELENQQEVVRCRSIRWRQESAGLTFDRGRDEFRSALALLIADEHLAGVDIRVVLGAEFCVTRYVSGPREKVTERVAELESECSRFLLLGQGRKLAASHVEQLEDGSYRGLVSAFNRQALTVILSAFANREIRVSQVNAAAVLLAGLVPQLDTENSGGLLLRLRDDRADVLVIDQGCLLLDVRPARQLDVRDLAGFVNERRALLERFYGWHALTPRRKLDCVYLAGGAEQTEVRTALLDQGLSVQALSDQLAGSDWPLDVESDDCSAASLAALCGVLPQTTFIECPDLLSVLQGRETQSLRARLKQTLWPLAAAALLCMMFHSLRSWEQRHSVGSEPAVMVYEDLQMEIEDLDYDREDREIEIAQLERVIRQSEEASLTTLIASVASCLPDDGSLTSWMLAGDGTLQLQGRCLDESSAYQFVEYIGRIPQISKASLAGTKTGGGDQSGMVEFDVVAEMRNNTTTTGLAHASESTLR